MKKNNKMTISFDSTTYIHNITKIIAHYYEKEVKIDDYYEKMTHDEYCHMMITKINNAKTEKERDIITEEYASNKYYNTKYRELTLDDTITSLKGYILFKPMPNIYSLKNPLVDFISYNLSNFDEFLVFFFNNFDYFIDKLEPKDIKRVEFYKLYKIKDLIELARKYFVKENSNLLKYQKIFKDCINFCYEINAPIDLSKLNLKQRFFLYNQIYHNPFKEFSNSFDSMNYLNYTYTNIPYNSEVLDFSDVLIVSKIIQSMDPNGTQILTTNQLFTNNIFTLYYIMMYNIIGIKDLHIKICGNCKRYFITPKKNVVYCDRDWDNDMSCKQIGGQTSQKRKEQENIVYGKYRSIFAKKAMNVKRNLDVSGLKDKYEKWKKQANKFYQDVKVGKKTAEEFDEWLEKNK